MALSFQIERAAARAGTGAIASGSADLGGQIALPAGDPVVDAAEQRAAGVTGADRILSHPCELSRKARITVCLRKGHAADAAALREYLQALGSLPTPAPYRKTDRITIDHRPTARCPVCRTLQLIRMDLTIGRHGNCDGEGQKPLREGQVST